MTGATTVIFFNNKVNDTVNDTVKNQNDTVFYIKSTRIPSALWLYIFIK